MCGGRLSDLRISVFGFLYERFGKTKKGSYFCALGEMAEWSIAAVLKTVDLHGSGGSNPSLSAKGQTNDLHGFC